MSERTPWPCRKRWFGWVAESPSIAAFVASEMLGALMKVWPHTHNFTWNGGGSGPPYCIYCSRWKPKEDDLA